MINYTGKSVGYDFGLKTFLTSSDYNDITSPLYLLNNIDKLNQQIGLDNILYLTCPKCGEEITTFFRFGPEFFRPTNI